MLDRSDLNPIKLLVLSHYYPEHCGGIEIVAGKLVEHLTQHQSVTVEWIASDTDSSPQDISRLKCLPIKSSNFIENKINIAYPLWNLSFIWQLWKAIQNTDIIHLHDYIYQGNIVALLIAKIKRKPVIFTQHIGFISYKNFLLQLLLSFLNKTLGRLTFCQADEVIFCSKVVENYWLSINTTFQNFPHTIPNGVDTNTFFPIINERERLDIRHRFNLPVDRLLFLFVGRFVEKKGLHILKQLAEYFPEIHWVFLGWGGISPESWHLNNVRVFRNLRDSQMTPFYQTADLLLLPSKGEGFPLVIQEAMACGTPAMVSTESANQYNSAKNLIFSEDVETKNVVELWSRKIEEIHHNSSSTLTQLRPKVADFAKRNWSWDRCASQYLEIFQQLSNSK